MLSLRLLVRRTIVQDIFLIIDLNVQTSGYSRNILGKTVFYSVGIVETRIRREGRNLLCIATLLVMRALLVRISRQKNQLHDEDRQENHSECRRY